MHVQGYLAHKKPPPRLDHHRALDINLLKGARVGRFLMSEVSLYSEHLNRSPLSAGGATFFRVEGSGKRLAADLQGYLAHKKQRPLRTLQ